MLLTLFHIMITDLHFSCFIRRCEKQELHLMQDELEDLRDCGIGACKPRFLQSLANIKVRHIFIPLLSNM